MNTALIGLKIPAPLRAYTDQQAIVQVSGSTVHQVLESLTGQYPRLQTHLLGEDGKLRSFVNIYLNGRDIRRLDGLRTAVSQGDKLAIIPAIAGGQIKDGRWLDPYSR